MKPRTNKLFVILFYVVFIAGTGLVTYVAVQANRSKTDVGTKFFPHLVCVGIEDPSTLLAEQDGEPVMLRLAGVATPSEALDATRSLDPAVEDDIARKTLLAYLYKRRIRFHPADGVPVNVQEGLKQGYVELYGVDVGKQLIENGQAAVSGQEHPRREIYLASQEEAKSKKAGIWRSE